MSNDKMKKIVENLCDKEVIIMPIERCLQVNNSKLKIPSKFQKFTERMVEKYPRMQNHSSLYPIEEKSVKTKEGPMEIQIF